MNGEDLRLAPHPLCTADPHGPRSRKRPTRRMRLRWANSISTFFRRRQAASYSGVDAVTTKVALTPPRRDPPAASRRARQSCHIAKSRRASKANWSKGKKQEFEKIVIGNSQNLMPELVTTDLFVKNTAHNHPVAHSRATFHIARVRGRDC